LGDRRSLFESREDSALRVGCTDNDSGHLTEALGWMEKAAAIAGETAKILCRCAVVYSFTDSKKFEVYLKRCLQDKYLILHVIQIFSVPCFPIPLKTRIS
jgi:hypothetical protein